MGKTFNMNILSFYYVFIPSQSNILTATGNSQSPTWYNYDTDKINISGTTSATNAGTYTAIFSLKPGYKWIDDTTENKSINWTINRAATTFDLRSDIPDDLQAGDILNVPYSGSYISLPLPKGSYQLECWGAQGGYRSSTTYGGKGGYAKGTLNLVTPTTLYIYAGGSGNTGGTSGGFNGGGKRHTYPGGGGASDVRIGTVDLSSRVIVAGGGGSDGATAKGGGAGGGTTAQNTTASNYGAGGYGGGASASSPNTGGTSYFAGATATQPTTTTPTTQAQTYNGFGWGGCGPFRSSGYGGAGGGGWYGGVGTYPDGSADDDKGGGGGSGYVYTSSTAENYPSSCTLNSSHYLSTTTNAVGTSSFTSPSGSSETGHSGDGYVRITVLNIIQ